MMSNYWQHHGYVYHNYNFKYVIFRCPTIKKLICVLANEEARAVFVLFLLIFVNLPCSVSISLWKRERWLLSLWFLPDRKSHSVRGYRAARGMRWIWMLCCSHQRAKEYSCAKKRYEQARSGSSGSSRFEYGSNKPARSIVWCTSAARTQYPTLFCVTVRYNTYYDLMTSSISCGCVPMTDQWTQINWLIDWLIDWYDMTAKVGIVERKETANVRQGHDKYISEAADTDATMECAVVFAVVRSNGAVATFPQQAINSQRATIYEGIFSLVSAREAILRGRECKYTVAADVLPWMVVIVVRTVCWQQPRVVLQRIGEKFPALRETMASPFCLFAVERVYMPSSPAVQGQRNRIYIDKIVLFFIIHVVTILWVAVGIVVV
jgi:hypothetical protein